MAVLHVQPLSTVRAHLSQVVARFRREGPRADPVIFGNHRKPEAVLVPYAAYVETQEWRHRLHIALNSARSVQIELPGAVSAEHAELVEAYVMGEIDAKEAYERTVARHRRMPCADYARMRAEADEHFGTADRVGDDDPWERDRG